MFSWGKILPFPKRSSLSDPSVFLLQPANARPPGSVTKDIQERGSASVKQDGLAGSVKPN